MLSDSQLDHKCLRYGGSACCRYLKPDKKNYQVYNCTRQVSQMKKDADADVAKKLKDAKSKGIDPKHLWIPLGNGNGCTGYPFLPTVKQGYDIKKKP